MRSFLKNQAWNKVGKISLLGVGVLFVFLCSTSSLKIDVSRGEYLKDFRWESIGLEIDFVTSVVNKSVAVDLLNQAKNVMPDYSGKVLVRVHSNRYSLVCYREAGWNYLAVPIEVPLDTAVARCMSRAGPENVEYSNFFAFGWYG
ncbi:hypothetical protein [Pseudomonas koreensis]|uniref:hypothetical protein n=1 Tax=Pseudomonas koreensis TaxID=198620 RepID=UPI0010C054A0|nr:hypothetical protein [Pseudomonas koreensis]